MKQERVAHVKEVSVSTPSRICLFGEHQDYLGLEVIAQAISLRFRAKGYQASDGMIRVKLTGEDIEVEDVINLKEPITYRNKRDYLRSTINVLKKQGYDLGEGMVIEMDSDIPIGKGMCSSTTMVIAFLKIILELIEAEKRNDPEYIAQTAFDAEVREFNEPGGLMDQYSSAYGDMVHLTFDPECTVVEALEIKLPGKFILFDSLEDKNTTKVLREAKEPVMEGLAALKQYGVEGIRDLVEHPDKMEALKYVGDEKAKKIKGQMDNYNILQAGLTMFRAGVLDEVKFGQLLTRHHQNLRDALGISTPKIEDILDTALANGALGGKINGSGGGGCCFVYVRDADVEHVISSVTKKGYKAILLQGDCGVKSEGVA